MTISDSLLLDFEPEMENTRRVLRIIPENEPVWKPHERSMPIGRLALHVARLPELCTRILTTEELNLDLHKFPSIDFESTAHLLSELERTAAETRSLLAAASDDDLSRNWKVTFKGRAIVDAPRMVLYRTMFLNHLVHHRAQLTVYLRLLDIKIPGLYGPSADQSFV